jgi:hypothetical protein
VHGALSLPTYKSQVKTKNEKKQKNRVFFRTLAGKVGRNGQGGYLFLPILTLCAGFEM